MVAAGTEEERARVAPRDAVEAERRVEEVAGDLDVAHVQVHVTDDRPLRHSRPFAPGGGTNETARRRSAMTTLESWVV